MRGKGIAVLVMIGCWLAVPVLVAADGKSASGGLSLELIDAKIKEIQAKDDLNKDQKAKIVALYQQATDELKAAADWEQKAKEFDGIQAAAPKLLKQLKKEFANLPDEVKPEVPKNASLTQLEQLLAKAEDNAKSLADEKQKLQDEIARRAKRRVELPKEVSAAKQTLSDVTNQLASLQSQPPKDEIGKATLLLLQARKTRLAKEIEACEKEIDSYDAQGDLLRARQDLVAKKLSLAEKLTDAWREIVNKRRRIEAEQAAREARTEAARALPAVKKLAEENARLAEERTGPDGLSVKIEQTSAELQKLKKTLASLQSKVKNLKDRVRAVGLTSAVGLLLRRQKLELPNVRELRRKAQEGQKLIGTVQLRLLDLEDQRNELADIDGQVQKMIAGLGRSVTKEEQPFIEEMVRSLLTKRREIIDALISDYDTYFESLVDVDSTERMLIDEVENIATYIDENVLWVRSGAVLSWPDVQRCLIALQRLVDRKLWGQVAHDLLRDCRNNVPLYACTVALIIVIILLQKRLRNEIQRAGKEARRIETDRFSLTVKALVITMVLACLWPAVLGFFAWRLSASAAAAENTRIIGFALARTAFFLLLVNILRYTCMENGLGCAHFNWRPEAVRDIRRQLRWFTVVGVGTIYVKAATSWAGEKAPEATLGRVAFTVAMVALAVFIWRLLRPNGPVLKQILLGSRGGWLQRLRYLWCPLAVGMPAILAALAIAGYYYTAQQLFLRLRSSVILIMAAAFLNSLLLRWLFVVRRRIALQKVQERKTEEQRHTPEPGTDIGAEAVSAQPEEQGMRLSEINVQTRQLIRAFLGLGVLIGLWVIWVDVLPALGVLKRVNLWPVTVKSVVTSVAPDGTATSRLVENIKSVTLADALLAGVLLAMTIIASKNIPGLLEILLLERLPLEAGVRYAISSISRYAITITGIVSAFMLLGVSWAKVQWLAAAVTVGLGFGLQEIFANFVSGLIILFERPIRLGDTVTVGDITGTVTKIRIRATTITDWDRKELIVPNREFITGRLVNWTLSDPILRVVIPVGVAYGSDTALVQELLLEVAKESPLVLDDPPSTAAFAGFGDSSLNFELRVFIPDFEHYMRAIHELHVAIDKAFRKANIEIPFPQQDVYVRSVTQPISFVVRPEGNAGAKEGDTNNG